MRVEVVDATTGARTEVWPFGVMGYLNGQAGKDGNFGDGEGYMESSLRRL